MILILPSNEHLNLNQVCSYLYKDGWMTFLTSSDRVFQFKTSERNAKRLQAAIDKHLGGTMTFEQRPTATFKPKTTPDERPTPDTDPA